MLPMCLIRMGIISRQFFASSTQNFLENSDTCVSSRRYATASEKGPPQQWRAFRDLLEVGQVDL